MRDYSRKDENKHAEHDECERCKMKITPVDSVP